MQVGMGRYKKEFPDADVVLFEPSRDDVEMFFTNVFSYSDRERLSEHAYQRTRAELRRRYDELQPVFGRHGIAIDQGVLRDEAFSLAQYAAGEKDVDTGGLLRTANRLNDTLDRLEGLLRKSRHRG